MARWEVGRVVKFKASRGYGFIEVPPAADCFFHGVAILPRLPQPVRVAIGTLVRFRRELHAGRERAAVVHVVRETGAGDDSIDAGR